MQRGVSCLPKDESVASNPSLSFIIDWRQEYVKNLFLVSVLFLLLTILAVFMYLGMARQDVQDNPGTRHIKPEGRSYVIRIMDNKEFLNVA